MFQRLATAAQVILWGGGGGGGGTSLATNTSELTLCLCTAGLDFVTEW